MHKYYDNKYYLARDPLCVHLAQSIKQEMKTHTLKTILDVGCGSGRLVQFLNKSGFQAKGCDLSPKAVAMARKLNGTQNIRLAGATKLPFKENCFSLVTSISVIEHLTREEGEKFIREAYRVLTPGGFIFLVTPNYGTPVRLLQGKDWFAYKDPTHIYYYTGNSLTQLVTTHGFHNPKVHFKIKYRRSMDLELPAFFSKSPSLLKKLFFFLTYSTSFSQVRNSVWLLAQKND